MQRLTDSLRQGFPVNNPLLALLSLEMPVRVLEFPVVAIGAEGVEAVEDNFALELLLLDHQCDIIMSHIPTQIDQSK
jgi:hypothetical protein